MRTTLWMMYLSVLLAGTALAQSPVTRAPDTSGSATKPNGTTGAATQVPTLTDTEIKQALEQEGFSNITVRHKNNGHADVTTMKSGRTQKLDVDPTTGQATAGD